MKKTVHSLFLAPVWYCCRIKNHGENLGECANCIIDLPNAVYLMKKPTKEKKMAYTSFVGHKKRCRKHSIIIFE